MEPNRQYCANAPERSRTALDAAGPSQRDRRMQLRAYNGWASLLGRRRFPTLTDLASGAFCDIAAHGVLLDVSVENEAPVIAYLGERLAEECAASSGPLRCLGDAPDGSLLSFLATHFGTVLVNRAPTGFEAECAGLRGATVLYRGILLPFSTDDTTIDFVLAVINWKEEAAPSSTEAGQQPVPTCRPGPSPPALLPDWADGPGSELGDAAAPRPDSLPVGETSAIEPALPGDEAPLPAATSTPAMPVALVEQLRLLPVQPLADLPAAGAEFTLALIRRHAGGRPALLGEVPHDPALIEQALRRLAR